MKYELASETKAIDGKTLYRIRALRDIVFYKEKEDGELNVKAGDLGGFVENEKNLSQEGDCWIYEYGDCCVFGNACVCDDAVVFGGAWVLGDVRICGCAFVGGNLRLSGRIRIENGDIIDMILDE